ncbi:MAG: chemotaxis protein CheW [bacterium]|nr:chemotaxis protein CheW [bacterium]
MPLKCVRRVLPAVSVHPVPGAKAPLLGLAQLGSEPILVLDLEAVVSGKKQHVSHRSNILTVQIATANGPVTVGLSIDEAVEVLRRNDGPLENYDDDTSVLWTTVQIDEGQPVRLIRIERLCTDGFAN